MWCIIFWCLFLTLSSIFSWIFSSYQSVLFANTHSIALSSCQVSPFGSSFWPADCGGAGLCPSFVAVVRAEVALAVVLSLVLPRFLVVFVAPFIVLVPLYLRRRPFHCPPFLFTSSFRSSSSLLLSSPPLSHRSLSFPIHFLRCCRLHHSCDQSVVIIPVLIADI